MNELLDFLNKLEENHIYYRLNKVRDAILVEIAVPGARWEVEFLRDGEIEVEKFISDGELCDASALDALFDAFQD
jgi:hypothetical protein